MQRRTKRKGIVRMSGRRAGVIEETDDGFRFTYDTGYLADLDSFPVSLTLPLRAEPYCSPHLFSYFYGMLAEGSLEQLQCRKLRIDPEDVFARLLQTTGGDVIGCVNVEPAEA